MFQCRQRMSTFAVPASYNSTLQFAMRRSDITHQNIGMSLWCCRKRMGFSPRMSVVVESQYLVGLIQHQQGTHAITLHLGMCFSIGVGAPLPPKLSSGQSSRNARDLPV
jgi:hypothetical protein